MRRIEEFITSQRKNDALAVIDSDGNELSYKKLYKASLSLANVINNKAEKNILIQADNNAFFVIGLFAIWMSDKTAVLVNPVSRPEEICQLAEFCESETVIVGQSNRKLDNIDCIQVREFIYGATNFILNINNNCNSDALIIPTTGTTEYPKHVVLTHENVLAAEVAIAHGWGTDIANRELCVLPMHTVSGCVGQLLYMLSIQASILILSGGLSIIKLKQLTQHYKPNILIITPTLLAMLMNKKEGRTMLAGFRNITLCGEKVNIKKVSEWKRMLPDTVISETYGCTESSSAVVGSWKK